MKVSTSFVLSILIVFCTGFETKASEINVTNSEEFQSALHTAQPGDVIILQAGTGFLQGQFVADGNGEPDAPITITGAEGASGFIQSDHGTGLTISGNYWRIQGISFLITKTTVGVLILGNNNILSSALISGIESGLEITGNENKIEHCVISASDGPSVYIGGNNNEFESNVVSASGSLSAVTLNGCCGKFKWDVYNGDVNVVGNTNEFTNVVMNNGSAKVTGCDNTFISVVVSQPPDLTSQCNNSFEQRNYG